MTLSGEENPLAKEMRTARKGDDMATIWDVAARANVSKSTVSLVLNNSSRVKEATREKVLEAIKTLEYIPNNNARNLQRKNHNSIGIIHVQRTTRDPNQDYGWEHGLELFSRDVEEGIFRGIVEGDIERSVVVEHLNIKEKPNEMPKILRECKVDGAIFVGGFDKKSELDFIKDVKVPVVMVTSSLTLDGVDLVMHDPAGGSRLAYEKLIETGHRKICLLNVPKHYRVWPQRVAGVMAAAESHDYKVDPNLLVSVEHNSAHSAYDTMGRLLDSGMMPDAVLTADVELAMGTMRCFWERGIRIPEDVSMICYEDSSVCGNLTPAMAAISTKKHVIGQTALKFLIERIENPDLPVRTATIEPHLVMRESVKDRIVR